MSDRLWNMLPAVYRQRDAENGDALRRLLEALDEEHQALEGEIERAYDNWFIETCEEPYVPLLGDLLGVRPLHPVSDATHSQRAWVGNTIAWRRRKGTAATLEAIGRDVTGWPAQAVEYFQRLAVTWHSLRPRGTRPGTASARDATRAGLVGGAFDVFPRSADVRSIARGRGRFNVPNVGLHLWRLQGFPRLRTPARPVSTVPDGRFTFHPLGLEAPLFHHPAALGEDERVVDEAQVPIALRRITLHRALEALRQSLADGASPLHQAWFGPSPTFQVLVDDAAIPPEQIEIANLGPVVLATATDWPRPAVSRVYHDRATGAAHTQPLTAAVDPERGLLVFRAGQLSEGSRVEVVCCHGAVAAMGGGSYHRDDERAALLSYGDGATLRFSRSVGTEEALRQAILDWAAASLAAPQGATGWIEILGNLTVGGSALSIVVRARSRLRIASQDGARAHLGALVQVQGVATGDAEPDPGSLTLDGLLCEGGVEVKEGNLGELVLSHCTLQPNLTGAPAGLTVTATNHHLRVRLSRSIVDDVQIASAIEEVAVEDSVLTSVTHSVVAGACSLRVERSTLLGACVARRLEASDSIFDAPAIIDRTQEGCVRFCYVRPGSRVPRVYRCADGAQRPVFTSRRYGDPGHAQLARGCPVAITVGASNGAEMGAFNALLQPQREANARQCLEEYLPYGLEAGIFHET